MDVVLFTALITPVLAVEVGLIVLAARDILRPDRHVRGGSKPLWLLVVIFVQLLGPLLYFAFGRQDE